MIPKEDLLKGIEHRDCARRVLDLAERALRTWEVSLADFLSPPEVAEMLAMCDRLADISAIAWGGYPQAERQRLAIARAEVPLEPEYVPLAALEIEGNFLFDTANHRDFLGSMLATGIVRDKTGDLIVLGERGAQAIVVPEIADFLQANLVQVRSVAVKVHPIELNQLRVREPRKKELVTVEASMRLDAIASAGFGMSRSKMADAIRGGDVRVNWKEVSSSSHLVKTGDLISIRSKGRLEVGDVTITKKQRYRVQLTRFV